MFDYFQYKVNITALNLDFDISIKSFMVVVSNEKFLYFLNTEIAY